MTGEFDLVIGLNYYAPYVSGLTEVARLTAEGMAARGYKVAVVTSRHAPGLPRFEIIGGVEVHRARVLARLGKGPVSLAFPVLLVRMAKRARVVHLHLPMIEAGVVATLAKHPRLVATYHCDVTLPAGAVNSAAVRVLDLSAGWALRRSTRRIVTSADYAENSRLAHDLADASVLPPPCVERGRGQPTFRCGTGPHIGFVGRIVEEKGLEHLVDGFLALDLPDARLLIAGDYQRVAGGSVVERLRARIDGDERIRLLGFLPDEQLADFYASLDVFALPSVNSLEAFGIVQVEAMMSGVPVVASNLPGVRVPIGETGFGRIVEPGDAAQITDALRDLCTAPPDRTGGANRARASFGQAATLDAYESLLKGVQSGPAR